MSSCRGLHREPAEISAEKRAVQQQMNLIEEKRQQLSQLLQKKKLSKTTTSLATLEGQRAHSLPSLPLRDVPPASSTTSSTKRSTASVDTRQEVIGRHTTREQLIAKLQAVAESPASFRLSRRSEIQRQANEKLYQTMTKKADLTTCLGAEDIIRIRHQHIIKHKGPALIQEAIADARKRNEDWERSQGKVAGPKPKPPKRLPQVR